jgi:lysine 2,3-aminomutase
VGDERETAIMEEWQRLLKDGINNADQLFERFGVDKALAEQISQDFRIRINAYYLSLIEEPGDPIWRQVVPDAAELDDEDCPDDPLNEEGDSPVPNLTHRYPDRVLFLVNHQCPIYCRFCTRKRKVSEPGWWNKDTLKLGIDYIRAHPEVRDIIVSGGDPMMLPDHMIEWILSELRSIPHVEIIRIGSRVPCALPQRITPELCDIIKKYHPVYVNTHFNHPREVNEITKKHCGMLADAGVPIGCQTVLLKGVNDDPAVMKELMRKLLTIRVRPYYIYQADLTKGTNYFRTRVEKGLEIIKALRGHTSGLAVPHYVIDAPGGGGKIPLLPEYVTDITETEVVMRNYAGKEYRYPQVPRDLPSDGEITISSPSTDGKQPSQSHKLRIPEPAALLD